MWWRYIILNKIFQIFQCGNLSIQTIAHKETLVYNVCRELQNILILIAGIELLVTLYKTDRYMLEE